MSERFIVEYLQHSMLKDSQTVTATVNRVELVELLLNGMVSVIAVRAVRGESD